MSAQVQRPDDGVQPGALVRVRGERWRVRAVSRWPDCVSVRLCTVNGGGRCRTLLSPFDRLAPLAHRRSMRFVTPRRWLHELRRLTIEGFPFGGARTADRAAIKLLPYQFEPLLAMLRRGAPRVLIADAVGLGKTVQAGLILSELTARDDGFRAMVIVPAGLREQWADELASHFGIAAVQSDAAWLRAAAFERPPDVNPWTLPGVYLASIDFIKRPEVLAALEACDWDLVAIDEAHQAATGTDRRAAAHAVASHGRRVLLLSATAHAGGPMELAALCRIGDVGFGNDLVVFRRTRGDADGGPPRRSVLLRVQPSAAERAVHDLLERYTERVWREADRRADTRAKLAMIVLRKRALSSAASLGASALRRLELLGREEPPPLTQLTLPLADEDPLEDGAPDAALAAAGLSDARRERRWLAAVAQAARHAAAAETKTRRLIRLMRALREPVLVFTEYRDTLQRLVLAVERAGVPAVVLHGGMDLIDRRRVQHRFNGGGVSLLATDAAAEGLNLHRHCRVVVHYELPWSAARLEQRAGRVDRLGQNRRVHEIGLIAAGTAERLVLAPLAARAARAREQGEDTAGLLALLTEERVADLVMNGRPLELPRTMPQEPQPSSRCTIDLREEAVAEVRRIEIHRRFLQQSSASPRASNFALTARLRRRDHAPSVVLRFRVSITDARGGLLHVDDLAVVVEIDAAAVRGSNARLRGVISSIAESPAVREHVWSRAQAALAGVAESARLADEEIVRRQKRLTAVRVSTARTLVQASLFQRSPSRRELHGASLLHDRTDDGDRTDSMSLTPHIELVAALIRLR
jgi:superfamily II DNA or RNA helicase